MITQTTEIELLKLDIEYLQRQFNLVNKSQERFNVLISLGFLLLSLINFIG